MKCVVISYVPLLTGRAGVPIPRDEGSICGLGDAVDSAPGEAKACLWAFDEDGGPSPVLLYDRAEEVRDHLVTWSEDGPEGWFRICVMESGPKYLVALTPDVDWSIERYRIAFQLANGLPIPPDAEYEVLFKPLFFTSGSSNLRGTVKGQLGKRLRVGLMEASEFGPPEGLPDPLAGPVRPHASRLEVRVLQIPPGRERGAGRGEQAVPWVRSWSSSPGAPASPRR